MSKESYMRGFDKVARDHNVNPAELMKLAQSITGYWQQPEVASGLANVGSKAVGSLANAQGKVVSAPLEWMKSHMPAPVRKATYAQKALSGMSHWLKNLRSVPGPRQYALGGSMAPRKVHDGIYGGYGNSQAYEDGYEAFQDQQ